MKKAQIRKMSLPTGLIRKDYPIGQFGGCPMGMYQSGPQAGGFPIIPAITAAYAGLKSVQPFSKVKRALEENVEEKGKKKLGYKIAHKIASVGTSLGFGQTSSNLGPISYQKKVHQPNLSGSKTSKRQTGAGKPKKRKHKKKK